MGWEIGLCLYFWPLWLCWSWGHYWTTRNTFKNSCFMQRGTGMWHVQQKSQQLGKLLLEEMQLILRWDCVIRYKIHIKHLIIAALENGFYSVVTNKNASLAGVWSFFHSLNFAPLKWSVHSGVLALWVSLRLFALIWILERQLSVLCDSSHWASLSPWNVLIFNVCNCALTCHWTFTFSSSLTCGLSLRWGIITLEVTLCSCL